MTYQSPGLERRSAFSAAPGSPSSGSAGSSGPAGVSEASSATGSAVSSATGSALAVSGASSAGTSGNAASMSTVSPTGRLPSEVVTVYGSFPFLCQLVAASAEHPQHQLGQAQIHQADQRHHEHQEPQHHRGVGAHLLAVGPDDLAQLGDELLAAVEDEDERVVRRLVGFARRLGFLCLFGVLARVLVRV